MWKEPFECERDGLAIRGDLFRVTEIERGPAVILSHGFLASARMCETYALLLAELGYTAVTFDFCGGGCRNRSGGKTEDMTIFTEKADLLAVLDHVKGLPYVDPARVSLLGCSQGGVVSAMAAKEPGTEIEKLILLYPAVCIADDARRGKMLFYRFDPANIPDILGRFPMKLGGGYARTVKDLDLYETIRGYEGPVLYLQGTEDKIVNVSYARKAKDCFPGCRYHEIEGGGHMFRGEADREACQWIRDFMED